MTTLSQTIQRTPIATRLFVLLLLAFTGFWLSNLRQIPFHPDESTQLYMSRDFDLLLSSPLSMAWTSATLDRIAPARYRLLDAPLTRYLLGFARTIANQPPLPVDWDWSITWAQNQSTGALPSENLLATARLAIAMLLPLTLFLIFKTGESLGGAWVGLAAACLLGLNPLVLLHARRAMAEGPLIFGISLVLYCLVNPQTRPWILGVALAVALNTKQSAAALLPVCLLALVWQKPAAPNLGRSLVIRLLTFALAGLGVVFLLNPFLWKSPWTAAQAAWHARQDLLRDQSADYQQIAPGMVSASPVERAGALLIQAYLAPPSFAEAGNYRDRTAASEQAYLANPLNNLLRGVIAGGVILILAAFGFLLSALKGIRSFPELDKSAVLLLAAALCQAAALVATVPLAFQRYAIPLIPFSCLWVGFAIVQLASLLLTPHKTPLSDVIKP